MDDELIDDLIELLFTKHDLTPVGAVGILTTTSYSIMNVVLEEAKKESNND